MRYRVSQGNRSGCHLDSHDRIKPAIRSGGGRFPVPDRAEKRNTKSGLKFIFLKTLRDIWGEGVGSSVRRLSSLIDAKSGTNPIHRVFAFILLLREG